MNSRLSSVFLALGLVFVLDACIIRSGSGSTSAPSSGDLSTVSGGTDPALVVRNASSDTICFVRLSPASSDSWGPDQLGASETIAPGQTRGWRMAPNHYDVRLEDCSNNVLLDQRNVPIAGDGILLTYQ